LFARLGLLEDAAPLFGSATAVPRAGVLLALPALVSSGVFECAQKIYGSLGPAFYGLRTSVLTLLLYVDGHARVYHGQHWLPKTHVTRVRISLPATSDYWVNDTAGDPLFVVTADANAGLVKMLPGILAQIRALVGKRRVTVVFDRGGYSPKLFVQIIAAGFDLLTYRKGRYPRIPRRRFQSRRFRIDGRILTYVLADQAVRLLKGKLRPRQITRLMDNGHQTPIQHGASAPSAGPCHACGMVSLARIVWGQAGRVAMEVERGVRGVKSDGVLDLTSGLGSALASGFLTTVLGTRHLIIATFKASLTSRHEIIA
jgi:hypothetical protein